MFLKNKNYGSVLFPLNLAVGCMSVFRSVERHFPCFSSHIGILKPYWKKPVFTNVTLKRDLIIINILKFEEKKVSTFSMLYLIVSWIITTSYKLIGKL